MALALNQGKVTYKPYIYYGMELSVTVPKYDNQGDKERGYILIHELWSKCTSYVLDISVTDTDAKFYQSIALAKVLERATKEKKTTYLETFLERRRNFMPLVYLVDGMVYKETAAYDKGIASLIASKWERQYSEMVGFVGSRMSILLIRSNTIMLCGSCFSKRLSLQSRAQQSLR